MYELFILFYLPMKSAMLWISIRLEAIRFSCLKLIVIRVNDELEKNRNH